MAKINIEWDKERQAKLAMPLGERELYPYSGMFCGEALKEYGVTVAFGVPGGHIWQLIDGISRIGIKMITFAHEQNGVYAAEAYSQVARRPGVCYGTVGPGVGNAVSPINQAWLSRSPVFFIAGGHEIEHDKLYNTIQEAYASEVCSTISKWAQRITYPNTIKQFFTRGLKLAMEFPYGPVVMEIGISCMFTPKEANDRVWYGAWGEHATWRANWRHGKENQPILSAGAPDDIAEVVNAIYKAEKPFGMLGDGAHWADCGPELLEFFRMAKVPFTTRRLGRGTIPETDPLCMRGMAFKKEIDLVVPVGVEIGFFDGYGGKWNEAVQIAESSDMIYSYVDTVGAIVGNPKIVAQQMIDYAKANNLTPPPGRDEWIKKCQDADVAAIAKRRAQAEHYMNLPRYKENNFMHHMPLAQMTVDYVAEKYNNAVRYFIDGYTMSGVVMPYLVCVKSAQILTASTYAGVGHSVGQSVGAAIAQIELGDKTPLLSFIGDGGMGNAMMDIEVAARYKLPIVYQVTNNDGWMPGSKYNWYGKNWEGLGEQEVTGYKWHGIEQMGEERLSISYERIAKELGCYAETVTKHEDYPAALDRCFKSAEAGVPAVLDCMMDKHLVNGAVTNPVYALMYQHLPWVDIPIRGKRVRRAIWGKEKAFKGLAKYPPTTTPNHFDPFEDWEMEITGEDWPMDKWPDGK
ncbi:MAG: thiamine pyrophosphate-binding protein [Desulfitobacteriaceae bacterium]|nr:thiamine pyrophosphate-binding protein [Desulfitobacteriaceae bacterium]MDD4401997.1 thiamine pyrophosphate-binding protein [Desulfitobacteriaceae bacterium]